jgi:excisionase family DNA binding protein
MNLINEDKLRLLMESVAEDAVEKVLSRYVGSLPDGAKDTKEDETDLLTIQEAADLLKISVATVRKWVKQGVVSYYRIGRGLRFKRGELLDMLTKTD